MKQVLYNKSGRVKINEVPAPEIQSSEILVQNEFSVLSAGTEKSMIQLMKKPLFKMALDRPDLAKQVINFAKDSGLKKTIDLVKSRLDIWHLLGYSSSGIVVRAGEKVRDIGVGDRVACIGSGFANHSEYIAVPQTFACKIPKKVKSEDAAFTGIASIGLQSIRQLKPQLGENIVVVGLGLIGQMVAQMLRANGCNVIGIDIDKTKVKKEYIDEGITADTVKSVLKATNNEGADGVIIAASSKHNLVNQAFDMSRKKGRVILLGVCGLEIDREKMFEKELEFKISSAFGPGSFDESYISGKDYPFEYVRWTAQRNMKSVLELLASNKLSFEEMKQVKYSLDEAESAYKKLEKGEVMTSLFKYNPSKPKQTIQVNKDFKKKKANLAIIGAGQFMRGFIIPSIKKNKDLSIYAVATKSGHQAKKLAKELGAKYASSSYKDLINDKNIDCIMIGTRHDTHAQIAIDALKKNKNVFCEKPMAIEKEEFNKLNQAIVKSNGLYSCGFNRRYSKAIKRIKDELKEDVPVLINYIFNNQFLPKEHWVNNPEIGGGRFIGEACHIIDLFNYLTGSTPIIVEGQKLSTSKGQINDENNISSVLKYKDGSLCTLTYTCIGNNSKQRETATIIQDGNIWELDGFGKVKKNGKIIYKGEADEGHSQEMKELSLALLGKENNLATSEECINATKNTFGIINKVKNNKNSE
ncbi:MAG: bi-domain-containing oxidoreductase [Nanobdellota archaeon]